MELRPNQISISVCSNGLFGADEGGGEPIAAAIDDAAVALAADLRMNAQVLARAERQADEVLFLARLLLVESDELAQLLHDLLDLGHGARAVDEPRQVQRVSFHVGHDQRQ